MGFIWVQGVIYWFLGLLAELINKVIPCVYSTLWKLCYSCGLGPIRWLRDYRRRLADIQVLLDKLIPNKVKQLCFQYIEPREPDLQLLLFTKPQKGGTFKSIKYNKMVFGNDMDCHKVFIKQLGIKLTEVSPDQSDVIIAFVPITSRAGTDIDAALKRIPEIRPLVLVAFHHTFDEDYIAPDSSLSVPRRDAHVVDCLFHEDMGMLTCPWNTKALEKTAEYLGYMVAGHRVAV